MKFKSNKQRKKVMMKLTGGKVCAKPVVIVTAKDALAPDDCMLNDTEVKEIINSNKPRKVKSFLRHAALSTTDDPEAKLAISESFDENVGVASGKLISLKKLQKKYKNKNISNIEY